MYFVDYSSGTSWGEGEERERGRKGVLMSFSWQAAYLVTYR
jgi:hypothetical protein